MQGIDHFQPGYAVILYTIDGGNRATITATNGRDPDNTQVFVSGVVVSGVSYAWSFVNSGGLLSDGNLSGAKTVLITTGAIVSISWRSPACETVTTLQLSEIVT